MDHLFKKLQLDQPCLIICPNEIKKSFLKLFFNDKRLYDIKWLNRHEFLHAHTFEISEDAHIHASLFLNKESSITKEMLSYLPYINEQHRDKSDHINQLLNLKLFLTEHHLLTSNTYFQNIYQDREIYVIGYPNKDKIFYKFLNKYSYKDIPLTYDNSEIRINAFYDESDEIIHLAEQISSLIFKGIPTNQIMVYTNNQNYVPYIEIIFERFNLKPNFTFNTSLYAYDLTKTITNYDQDDISISDAIKHIYEAISKTYHSQSEKSKQIYKKFIEVLNTYFNLIGSFIDYKKLIISDIKDCLLPMNQYENGITIGNITNYDLNENIHIFILGMNANEIPNVSKNIDFLSDAEKEIIELETSSELIRKNKYDMLDFISRCHHLTISYKKISARKEVYPSAIIEEIERPLIYFNQMSDSTRYSMKQDVLTLKKRIDLYKTYQVYHPQIDDFYPLLSKHIPKPYDNQFSTIDQKLASKLLKNKHTLSYTKLNTYFECPFKFLLQHIIKIDDVYKESMSLHIGNFFHDVLKDYTLLSFDKEVLCLELKNRLNSYISNKQDVLTLSQQFYLNHSIEQLSEVVIWLKSLDQRSNFKVYETEKKVELSLNSTYIKKLVGKIDKIMTLDDAHKTLYIVDYKTGKADRSLDYIHKGLYAQLMFYLLFLYKTIDSPTFVAFFYQKIYASIQKAEQDMDYLSILKKQWSLNGYHISNPPLVTEIDPQYDTYKTLSHYKLNLDDTPAKSSWIYEHQDLVKLITDFESFITNTIDNIEKGMYSVSPIELDDASLSKVACAYCDYKDICFVKSKDFIHTTKRKVFTTEGDPS